jgi:predicted phosphatase
MNIINDNHELFEMLEHLKRAGVLSIRDMNGEEITLLEKLVALKLASKLSTRTNSFYYYGIGDDHEGGTT